MSNSNSNVAPGALVRLDGSTGEGGGQILRNGISYATILQRPMEIDQIRAKRSKPGLRAQHVASIQLPAELGGGHLTGDKVGSSRITYTPSHEKVCSPERTVTKDIGTAGSICLLLQAALPCALLQASSTTRMVLMGGTNATLAPQYDYWSHVFLPTLQHHCGLSENQVQARVDCRGYFPRGGGKVQVTVDPLPVDTSLQPIQLTERGDLASIYIRSFHAGKLPRHLAKSMARSAQNYLQQHLPILSSRQIPVSVDIVTESNAVGSALGILMVATTITGCKLAGSALSSPKQSAEHVGESAAKELVQAWRSGGCVDEWLQDQLIIYMALAQGTSRMVTGCLTLHTQTAIWTAEQFCGQPEGEPLFRVEKLEDSSYSDGGDGVSQSAEPHKKRPKESEPTSQEHTNDKDENYGQEGLIPGRHLITCRGIGLKRSTK